MYLVLSLNIFEEIAFGIVAYFKLKVREGLKEIIILFTLNEYSILHRIEIISGSITVINLGVLFPLSAV